MLVNPSLVSIPAHSRVAATLSIIAAVWLLLGPTAATAGVPAAPDHFRV